MPKPIPPTSGEISEVFAALSQETRLAAYRLLIRYRPYGLAAGDISRLLWVPHNTLSTHLRALEKAGLVHSRKQGRSVIFVADTGRLEDAAMFLGISGGDAHDESHPAPALRYPSKRPDIEAPDHRIYNVLILCSSNSARSLIGEAIVNREGYGRFQAYSAGSVPKQKAHPIAIEMLDELGYDTSNLRPKSWTEFTEPGAPQMDFVITVCDKAIGEACPSLPGHPLSAHWGIRSIAELAATQDESRAAFAETYRNLMNRFTMLINLDVDKLPLDELKRLIQIIGKIEGATDKALNQSAV